MRAEQKRRFPGSVDGAMRTLGSLSRPLVGANSEPTSRLGRTTMRGKSKATKAAEYDGVLAEANLKW